MSAFLSSSICTIFSWPSADAAVSAVYYVQLLLNNGANSVEELAKAPAEASAEALLSEAQPAERARTIITPRAATLSARSRRRGEARGRGARGGGVRGGGVRGGGTRGGGRGLGQGWRSDNGRRVQLRVRIWLHSLSGIASVWTNIYYVFGQTRRPLAVFRAKFCPGSRPEVSSTPSI